jgi:transcription initiation factor TFIID subunit 12
MESAAVSTTPIRQQQGLSNSNRNSTQHLLPKKRLTTLLSQLDPNERLDTDVEEILLLLADEFIDSVTRSACELAKHRKSNQLGVQGK